MKKNKKTIMYNLLLITALAIIPQTGKCDEKEESTSRKELDLKGPVVVVVEKDCQFEKAFGEIRCTGSKDVRKCFYSNGRLAKQVNSPTSYKKYEYDKNGNLISISSPSSLIKYNYDQKANLISKITIDCSNNDHYDTINTHKYEYEYSSTGRIIRKIDLGITNKYADNSGAKEYVYEYNSNGKISETMVFTISDGSKKQEQRLAYSYTNGGRKISTYSEKGLEKEEIYSGLNQIVRENKGIYWNVYNYKLDNNKHPIKGENVMEPIIGKKVKIASTVFNYDSKGNLIKMSTFKSSESKPFMTISTKYTYDSHGNWTKKLTYINNNLTSWEEREFIYAKNENDYKKYNQDDISIFF